MHMHGLQCEYNINVEQPSDPIILLESAALGCAAEHTPHTYKKDKSQSIN